MRSVKVFEASTGSEIAVLRGLEATPRRLAMSHDGGRAAATARGPDGRARQVLVWDTLSGRVLAEFRPGGSARAGHLCGSVALSPDGRLVAYDDDQATNVDGPNARVATRVRVCEVTSARELLAAPAADEGIGCLAFSPDGLLVAAAGADGRVLVWETASGQVRCDDHLELSPLGLAFSPDSRRLAAVNREIVTIWDMETGKGIFDIARIAAPAVRPRLKRHSELEPRWPLAGRRQLGRQRGDLGWRRQRTPHGVRLVSPCSAGASLRLASRPGGGRPHSRAVGCGRFPP